MKPFVVDGNVIKKGRNVKAKKGGNAKGPKSGAKKSSMPKKKKPMKGGMPY